MSRLAWVSDELADLASRGLLRRRRVRTGPASATTRLDGADCLNFGSNDYLGLAADPRLAAAAALAAGREGWGAGASPLICGYSEEHAALEAEAAAWWQTPAVLACGTGYTANVGAITALVGSEDAVFSDAANHASIIDGCRLSRARVQVYRHGDVDDLRAKLAATPARRRLIVTDGLFSMDGDTAPLASIAELADDYDAILMVDEAHAVGVLGPDGRGAAAACGVADRVDVHIGTLSKAFGGVGALVAGSRDLVEWLVNRARPYFFSTAHLPAAAAAARAAIRIGVAEPDRRERLLRHAERLRTETRRQGWRAGGEAQIVPIAVETPEAATKLSAALADRGCFVPGIRPPSVPEGGSLLRVSLSAAHSDAQVDQLLAALEELRDDAVV